MGAIGPVFDCEWPAKSLQDLFHPTKVVPDPELKPFDLESLKPRDGVQTPKVHPQREENEVG
jgi:hypothetical protein